MWDLGLKAKIYFGNVECKGWYLGSLNDLMTMVVGIEYFSVYDLRWQASLITNLQKGNEA